jgi:hypothetical protein
MPRPVLPAQQPTEVAPSYQPTEVAPSYQPTEVAPSSYQPTEVAPSSYQPTQAAPSSYQPTEVASSYQPTVPGEPPPSNEPTTVSPRPQDAPARSNPTVTSPQIRPNADPWEQPTAMAAGPFAPPAPPTNFDPSSPLGSAPARSPQSPELMRYGPGVPPSQASVSAEQVWRTGHMPEPPPKRRVRYRALASLALTVILLAAAGVLLFLRFHHSPFKVTGAPTLSTAQNGCTVNVTGQIPTNGSSGTISYEWVFTPQQGAPQPLSQSVVSGQHDVFVTVAVQGQGHGTASEKVTLQLLGHNQESASTVVKVSC